MKSSSLAVAAALALAASLTPQLHAVITHPGDDVTIASVPRPSAAVVGAWGSNGSAVAIDPNHILTVRHTGGGVGTTVVFNGTPYVVADQTPIGTADLRVARITTPGGQPANLASFTPIYTGNDAAVQPFTLGGFGYGRGADLTTTGGTYGYAWGNTFGTLRFGRNQVDAFQNNVQDPVNNFFTDLLYADFDARGAATSVPFEAIAANFDSGSPWFIENGAGNWQVVALTRAVGHTTTNADEPTEQALFASHLNALAPVPDVMDAVRLSHYTSAINAAVPEPTLGLLTLTASSLLLVGPRRRRHPSKSQTL